jgi:putative transposase
MDYPDHLPRLDAPAYRGTAWVHWTMTMRDRSRGWLDVGMHSRVRELLLHAMARHHLHCAAYCLMPDHAHFLWMGFGPAACIKVFPQALECRTCKPQRATPTASL